MKLAEPWQIDVEHYAAVKKECSLDTMKLKIFRKYYVKQSQQLMEKEV